jgi:hypothetical protein
MMHNGRGMERILRDFGINPEHFTAGRPEAIAAFAEAAGHPAETLQRSVVRAIKRGGVFRGEDISQGFLSACAARYCPACLEEDGAQADRRFRLIWGFRHVTRCDRHDLRLADTSNKTAKNLRIALATSPLAQPVHAANETPDYLKWLRGRIEDGPRANEEWLDGQTIDQVLSASEMLGAILEHGHKVAVTKLPPTQTEDATDIGFAIYRDGPQAISEALDTIRQNSPATAVQAGPLAHYGVLFDWLNRRSNAIDPGPIRDLLRDHIVKHAAVEPGTSVLGVEIAERKFHTLHSLSSAVGVERLRLARLLKKLGQISEDATEVDAGNMVFQVATTGPLIEAFKTAVPLKDVPDYLGATKGQIEALYRVGILQPFVPRTGPGSVRNVVFARKHLDSFLQQVSGFPALDEHNSKITHPIAYACQRGAGPFEAVFASILDGQITCFRNPRKSGISAIEVDVNSLITVKTSD